MPDPFEHCESLVRAADKDRYLATLFAPERYRRPLFALYAFNVEIGRVRDMVREPMAGELRLQWWHDVLTGFPGEESGPVAAALAAVIVRYRLPLHALTNLIDARRFDVHNEPIDTLAELETYLDNTTSAVMGLAAQILNDGGEPQPATVVRHAGIACGLTALMTAFARHATRGQLYLPLELLQRHGARAEDAFAGRSTPALRAALAELCNIAHVHLTQVMESIASLPSAVLPALLPVALVGPMLRRLRRQDPLRLRPLPQWRRQWLLWRAARNPRRLAT